MGRLGREGRPAGGRGPDPDPRSHRILPADSGRVAPHVTVLGHIVESSSSRKPVPSLPRRRARAGWAGPGRPCSASSPHPGGPGLPGAAGGVRPRGKNLTGARPGNPARLRSPTLRVGGVAPDAGAQKRGLSWGAGPGARWEGPCLWLGLVLGIRKDPGTRSA